MVGYLAKDRDEAIEATTAYGEETDDISNYEDLSFKDLITFPFQAVKRFRIITSDFSVNMSNSGSHEIVRVKLNNNGEYNGSDTIFDYFLNFNTFDIAGAHVYKEEVVVNARPSAADLIAGLRQENFTIKGITDKFRNIDDFNAIQKYHNKVIKKEGTNYLLKVRDISNEENILYGDSINDHPIIRSWAEDTGYNIHFTPRFEMNINSAKIYVIEAEETEISTTRKEYSVPSIATTAHPTCDATYDMFAIPFNQIRLISGTIVSDNFDFSYPDVISPTLYGPRVFRATKILTPTNVGLSRDATITAVTISGGEVVDLHPNTATINADGNIVMTVYTSTAFDVPENTYTLNITADVYEDVDFYTKEGIADKVAQAIQVKGASNVYDIQLLPYCPFTNVAYDNGFRLNNLIEGTDYILVKDENEDIATIVLFCDKTTKTFNINQNLDLKDSIKVDNECDMYRLCSPNWNGIFEFNVARNGGSVLGFNVDFNYKPYQPYIHINPIFNGLYGRDFNDARGLICGGDFSLAQNNDAWNNYTVNNKNYQNIFDRQIQNMDFNAGLSRLETGLSAVTGTFTGAASGATAGFMMGGGPVGAVVGGAIGAATSLAGGIGDIAVNEQRLNEQRDLTIDMHNYQLGNIKAIPQSITKVGAFNENNKIWPVIEYYTCTDKEKQAFKNKLKYDGMTVCEIATINDYVLDDPSFIKGQLIRLEDISEDSHMAYAIYEEIKKGVYL